MAQVVPNFGAGGIFGVGPAPAQRTEPRFTAQVPTIFPHLRQNPYTPAPTISTTCANDWDHLKNGLHHLDRLEKLKGKGASASGTLASVIDG